MIDLLLLVAYDVDTKDPAGARRLRRVAKLCVNKGQRVQNSVFECLLNNAEYQKLKSDLSKVIDSGKDSLRFYNLGDEYRGKIESLGRDNTYDPEGTLFL